MDGISRKDFFKEFFGFFKQEIDKGSIGRKPQSSVFIPPPGIQSVDHYLQNCDQCYECVAACPPLALQVCRDESSRLYGYPVLEPRREVCTQCADYPCIQACQTPALSLENKAKILARAQIIQDYCLAYQNSFCISCLNACPPQFAAIKLTEDGFPEIQEELCTGCGLCVHACPAQQQAIVFKWIV